MRARVRLYTATDFRSAWSGVLGPWLEASGEAWRTGAAQEAVLVPSFDYARFLKAVAVEHGRGLLGVRFLTHFDCWKLLHARIAPECRVAERADLHLLLAAAAAEHPDNPSARSAAVDPSALMSALDKLAAAGWTAKELPVAGLGAVVARFRQSLAEAALATAQELDSRFAAEAGKHEPLFSRLLVVGFDGSHWQLWNLLSAAVASAAQATMCLFDPRSTGESLDQVWTSSWEEAHGEASRAGGSAPSSPFAALADAVESGLSWQDSGADPVFLVGNDTREEARAAVAQAALYLAEGSCRRLGIIVPGRGPLAREVGRLLCAAGIHHNDTVGHSNAIPEPGLAWRAWLAFQEHPGAPQLLELLRRCPAAAKVGGLPSVEDASDALDRAYGLLMTDDARVLAVQAGWDRFGKLLPLPAKATFAKFADATLQTIAAMNVFPGEEVQAALAGRAACLAPGWKQVFDRKLFLEWLAATTTVPGRATDEQGSHPYSRVHIVTYDKAEWQQWSNLILTGLNSDNWPPEQRGVPFLDQETVRRLNARAVNSGSQGAGQSVVRAGHSLIVGPAERSEQARRRFYNAVASASDALCLTASRMGEEASGRRWNPSDLLVRLHAAVRGEGMSDGTIDRLQSMTSAWLGKCRALFPSPADNDAAVLAAGQTAAAYKARRDPQTPFGQWDFGLARPPVRLRPLACTTWQRAVRWPELAWMEHFLGVTATEWSDDEIPWRMAIGLLVHKWTAAAVRPGGEPTPDSFAPLPPAAQMHRGLERERETTMAGVARAFSAADGASVPQWWLTAFTQASAMAQQLLGSIERVLSEGWTNGATEWTLPKNARALLADGTELFLRGRIDLVLSRGSGPLWVVDYKTGARSRPSASVMANTGVGLQVLLYALALKAAGAEEVQLTLASPLDPLVPQATAGELLDDPKVASLLSTLQVMQRTGVFGMKGGMAEEYGAVAQYPLAMLPVNDSILAAKRAITFGME